MSPPQAGDVTPLLRQGEILFDNFPLSCGVNESALGGLIKEKVEAALEKVRPSLQADGGNVELLEVTDEGIVKVKLTGACGGCPMSQMTLKMGIERVVKEAVPEVKEVIAE